MADKEVILVEKGRIFDHDGDTDIPPLRDLLIVADRIVAIEADIGRKVRAGEGHPSLGPYQVTRFIDARDRLVLPGFFNAHYHSHDTLLKGCFETIPLDFWSLYALPASYPRRSKEELWARTIIGAIECIRSGMTTVQDMNTVFPFSLEDIDTILSAYKQVGLRCVFAVQFANIPRIKVRPYWDELIPESDKGRITAGLPQFPPGSDMLELMESMIRDRRGNSSMVEFALAPASPESCTADLLERVGDLSRREDLPIYTHIYENKGMTLIGRLKHQEFGGSLIRYLEARGLLGPRLTLAHSIWLLADEIEKIAETRTNVALNPVGNLKTRSGIAPIGPLMRAGVNIGIGCDNCSCSDSQNMFQAMKLFTGLAAVSDPEPGPPYAKDAIRAATIGSARTASMDRDLGALKPGMKADLVIIDLNDISYVPLNSAARQIVFTEGGRAVETVIINGKLVMENRRVLTVDEEAVRRTVNDVMPNLMRDLEVVKDRLKPVHKHILEAHRRSSVEEIGVNRYVIDSQFKSNWT